jgi:hypothetical protein
MIWLSKLTERPVYCRDEICKLTGPYSLMPYIAPDYFRRESRSTFRVSITFLPELFSGRLIYARRQTDKREFSGVSPVISTGVTTLPKK